VEISSSGSAASFATTTRRRARSCTPGNRGLGEPDRWPSLQDAAQGLVSYVVDAHVHLLRLRDGADAVVGPGSLARFMNAGLVYADEARIHLAPFAQLPLR